VPCRRLSLRRLLVLTALLHGASGAPLAAQEGVAGELQEARRRFVADSSPRNRLRLAEAELRSGNDSAARSLLTPLSDDGGRAGAGARRALALLAVRQALRDERQLDPASFPPRSIGVAPFTIESDDAEISPLGAGLADLLLTDLSRSAQLEVVDRVRVHALLRELALARSGAVDSATAPRAGRLLGARRLVSGAVTRVPDGSLRVDARVADASTTESSGAPISTGTSLDAILDAEKTLALRLFDELGVTLSPAERRAVEERPTRDVAAFLAYSRAVHDEIVGDYVSAARSYQQALEADPGFGLAGERLAALPEAGPPTTTLARQRVARSSTLDALLDALNPSPASALGVVSGWPPPVVRVLDSMTRGGTRPPGQ
jgi:TolB-like protein